MVSVKHYDARTHESTPPQAGRLVECCLWRGMSHSDSNNGIVKFIGMLRGQVLLRDRVPNNHLGKWAQWPGTCISFRRVSGAQTHTRILSRPTCRLAMLLRVLPVEIWPELSYMEFRDIARRFRTRQALVLAQIRVQELDESYWK